MERKIFGQKKTTGRIGLKSFLLVILAIIIGFEIFAIVGERKSRTPLPPLFGNFAKIRALLEKAEPKEEFSFAVFGDTEGATGSFDLLARKLRDQPVDFAVHLGDAYAKTFPYFRAKLSDLALPFPVFFVAGNHDLDGFSLPRFEESFGPSLFSFTYQDCLFVGLRIQGDSIGTAASLQFLEEVLMEAGDSPRKIFVFMHVPTPVLPHYKFAAPKELNELFARYKVDYAISGHYHGYAHVQKGYTTHLVSGTAGKHLEESPYGEFHHGLVITVGSDFVAKKVVPLQTGYDVGNKLLRFAIVEFYPWLGDNRGLAATANLFVLLLAVLTIRSLIPKKR